MLRLDPRSDVPPYEQLRVQLVGQIQSGDLEPGTRLPSVRKMAGDLGVAPGTVARAYRELEQTGLLQTSRRHGTTVAEPAPPGARSVAQTDSLATKYVATMRALRLDDDAILAATKAALAYRGSASAAS